MSRYILPVVLLACFTPHAVAKPVKELKRPLAEWSVLSLVIQKPGVFPYQAGTRIIAKVHVPNRFIVGIDADETAAKITDDKGQDLQAKPFKKARFGLDDGRISEDLRYGSILFSTSQLPHKASTQIKVKGIVGMLLGGKEKSIDMQSVGFETGEVDLGIGKLALRTQPNIGKANKLNDFNTLSYTGAKAIKTLTFISAAGKEVEFTRITQIQNPNNNNLFHYDYHAKIFRGFNLEGCTLRIVYFDSYNRVSLPVDLTVGLGF
jgi:hypothetical protein